MSRLNWKLLIKRHAGVTQGLPPGKEDLVWVANTADSCVSKTGEGRREVYRC